MIDLVVARTRTELRELALSGQLIAGGTDILVQIRAGRKVLRLVDISNLDDAPPAIAWRDGVVEISAVAPIARVVEGLSGALPALASSAALFGSMQIRNRATIGGNLANASPAADMVPPLVAAEAMANLEGGAAGPRSLPVVGLATAPGRTALIPGEWISSLTVPLPQGEDGFRKLGGRSAMAISIASLAWRWRRLPDGTLTGVCLALGAVAPTVVLCREAGAELEGHRPEGEAIERAVAALEASVVPIDDVRASAWYRRRMVGELLREALAS
jgi:CO/xanthine dehydrogenase FAD-binding subunit